MSSIYTHISRNRWQTVGLLILLPVGLLVITFVALLFVEQDPNNTFLLTVYLSPFIIGVGLFWMLIAYYFGDKIILSSAKSKAIEKRDHPEIYRIVENIAITAGLPTPKIYLVEDESLNAFATGRNPTHASIGLTTGIVKKLDKQELEAVVAHEMGHIGNRDIRLMLLIVVGIGVFAFMGEMILRSLRFSRSSNKKGNGAAIIVALGLAFLVFGYLFAPLIRFAIGRRRELLADSTSGILTRNPLALATALEKISADPRVEVLDSRPTIAAICIADPSDNKKPSLYARLAGLYATHPPITERVKALKEMGV